MRDEYAAFKALIETVPSLAVFDADDVTQRPALYVEIYNRTPLLRQPTLDADETARVHTFAVMHKGTSSNEVGWSAEKVIDILKRQRLTVAGRTSSPLRLIGNAEVAGDPDTNNPKVYTATTVWRCAFDRR